MKNSVFEISHEVKNALDNKTPIVGVESANSLLYCGKYPENIRTAISIEETIRKNGAIPATIMMLDGRIKVGVSNSEFEKLNANDEIGVVAKRDIPFYMDNKTCGATTVSATICIANNIGIKVVTSGGIGGVHVGAENSFDISSDLYELTNNSIAVVCSGSQSFIDAKLTLEYLETYGVPVIGYKTSNFPSFLVRETGVSLKYSIDDIREVARIIKNQELTSLKSGALITTPIAEDYAIDREVMKKYIDEAINYSVDRNREFGELTPSIFSKIDELTSGKSVNSNIELLIGNAQVASELSVALSELE